MLKVNKLKNKTLSEMGRKDLTLLLNYKLKNNREKGIVKALELNSVIHALDNAKGRNLSCIWYVSSIDKTSSSFYDVKRNHPTLAKCKYDCKGHKIKCSGYRVLINEVRNGK